VPRSESNALLKNVREVRERAEQLMRRTVVSFKGKLIQVNARTICIHGDTPRAMEFATLAKREMK
jgi:UPF0271 protein